MERTGGFSKLSKGSVDQDLSVRVDRVCDHTRRRARDGLENEGTRVASNTAPQIFTSILWLRLSVNGQ